MAYRKVDDGQGRPLGGEVLQCSEGLGGLDWSLDKEGDLQEPEPGLVCMQLQHAEHQRTGTAIVCGRKRHAPAFCFCLSPEHGMHRC